MNDKDKEAFIKYMGENLPYSYYVSYHCPELKTWQAACEYVRDEFKFQTPPAVVAYMEMNDKLIKENKKLREALEEIKDYGYATCDSDGEEIYNIAREALKEDEGA